RATGVFCWDLKVLLVLIKVYGFDRPRLMTPNQSHIYKLPSTHRGAGSLPILIGSRSCPTNPASLTFTLMHFRNLGAPYGSRRVEAVSPPGAPTEGNSSMYLRTTSSCPCPSKSQPLPFSLHCRASCFNCLLLIPGRIPMTSRPMDSGFLCRPLRKESLPSR